MEIQFEFQFALSEILPLEASLSASLLAAQRLDIKSFPGSIEEKEG